MVVGGKLCMYSRRLSVLNDRIFKSILCTLHEFLFFSSAQIPLIAHSRRNVSVQLIWRIWMLHLTPYSKWHIANPSNPAQHLIIWKDQIHFMNNSFIWHQWQLWDVDKVPFFLPSIHPPNSWLGLGFFFFSLLSFLVYSRLLCNIDVSEVLM